jgi:hypothetical protein
MGFTPPIGSSNLCPFISGPIMNSVPDSTSFPDVIWVDCATSSCRLWDSTIGECRINIIGQQITTVYKLDIHKHNSHDHLKPHSPEDLETPLGQKTTKVSAKATPLIVEDSGGEDMDGNGFIYGVDFAISPDSTNIPNMIKTVSIKDTFTGDYITWDQYIDSTSRYSIHATE